MATKTRAYQMYVVECVDGTLYTGVTTDVQRRLIEHNTSIRGAKYTRSRRPVRLAYVRRYRSRAAAQRAEAVMKKKSRRGKLTILRTQQVSTTRHHRR